MHNNMSYADVVCVIQALTTQRDLLRTRVVAYDCRVLRTERLIVEFEAELNRMWENHIMNQKENSNG